MSEPSLNPLDEFKRALERGEISQRAFDAAAIALGGRPSRDNPAQEQGPVPPGQGTVVVGGDNNGTINLGTIIQLGLKPGASEADLRRADLARIMVKANQLPFTSDPGNTQVRLSSVYTALLTQRNQETPAAKGMAPRDDTKSGRDPLSALDVLNLESRLVLLGGPGSGKSTFVNIVALSMAGDMLDDSVSNLTTLRRPLPDGRNGRDKPRAQHWDHEALLPVLVVMRDLASNLPSPGTEVNSETVWAFIVKQLEEASLGDFAPLLKAHLIAHGGLVMLDGLDEVPDARNRRQQIRQAVNDFVATISK